MAMRSEGIVWLVGHHPHVNTTRGIEFSHPIHEVDNVDNFALPKFEKYDR